MGWPPTAVVSLQADVSQLFQNTVLGTASSNLSVVLFIVFAGATAVVLCFDLTDQESFHNCNRWMADIEQFCPTDAAKILIGTKVCTRVSVCVIVWDLQC